MLTYIPVSFLFSFKNLFGLGLKIGLGLVLGLGFRVLQVRDWYPSRWRCWSTHFDDVIRMCQCCRKLASRLFIYYNDTDTLNSLSGVTALSLQSSMLFAAILYAYLTTGVVGTQVLTTIHFIFKIHYVSFFSFFGKCKTM